MTASVLRLATTNDRNGNPRRVYLHLSGDTVVRAYDEGYYGSNSVPAEIRDIAHHCPTVETTPHGYREALKRWR